METKYKARCRMCALESINTVAIFDSVPRKYQIAHTISQHFPFQPSPDDRVSNAICPSCWTQIETFHVYYLMVEDAQRKLSELHLKATVKGDDFLSNNIKQEFESVETIDVKPRTSPSLNDDFKTDIETDTLDTKDFEIGRNDSDVPKSVEKKPDPSEDMETSSEEDPSFEPGNVNSTTEDEDSEAESVKVGNKQKYRLDKVDKEIAKQTKLQCDMCNKVFDTFSLLRKHYNFAHKTRGYVVCCSEKFTDRRYFLDHILNHLDPDQLKCKLCDKKFARKSTLQNHMNGVHPPADAPLFKCDHCPRTYAHLYLVRRHAQYHLPETNPGYACEVCNKIYKTAKILHNHRRYVHENVNSYMCDICAKVIQGKSAFERHKGEHDGNTEIAQQCKECGKWYESLRRHLRVHDPHDVEKCTCDICGKISSTRQALQRHKKVVHEDKPRHKCTLCEKDFKRLLNLKEHMATHTGVILYTCKHCPKTFNSVSNMHKHTKNVHREEWEEDKRNRESQYIVKEKVV